MATRKSTAKEDVAIDDLRQAVKNIVLDKTGTVFADNMSLSQMIRSASKLNVYFTLVGYVRNG